MVVGRISNSLNGGDRQLSKYESSSAGFFSGLITRAVIQPLDVLKIRFQLQEEPLRRKSVGKYRGIVQSIKLIHKEEGLRAFWRGQIPAQGLSAVFGLVQFSTFEYFSRNLKTRDFFKDKASSCDFLCGASAGCAATICSMPFDVIRTRLIAQGNTKMYKGSLHAFFKIGRMEGPRGFFSGLSPSLLQVIPFAGLQFVFYNFLNDVWNNRFKDNRSIIELPGRVISGFLAGTMAKSITYPLDLLRHRFQVNSDMRKGFGQTSRNQGVLKAFFAVIKREEFSGLFKGYLPSLIKTGSNSALSFFFYELFCDFILKNR